MRLRRVLSAIPFVLVVHAACGGDDGGTAPAPSDEDASTGAVLDGGSDVVVAEAGDASGGDATTSDAADASDAGNAADGADAAEDAPNDASSAADASGDADADASACTPFLAASVTASEDISGGVCAIDLNGAVYCWDLLRAFPGKDNAHLYEPVAVTGLSSGAARVAFGRSAVYVIMNDGTVKDWGDNDCGQLGDGTQTNRYTLGAVSGLTQADRIVGSQYGLVFAMNKDGSAASWGDITAGSTCAPDSKQWSPTPLLVAGVSPVAMSTDVGRTCAVLPDKTVACFNGGLTYTASVPAGYRPATTTAISGLSDIAEVGTHYGNPSPGIDACARKNDGTVWCWLGTAAATQVTAWGSSVAQLAGGWRNDCARNSDGSVACWGPNSGTYFEGVVGDGTGVDRPSPVALTSLGTTVTHVSVGMRTACAIKSDHTLWCWGYRPGDGSTGVSTSPVRIEHCP